MKKVGIIIFIIAVMIGVVFANFFSFGKVTTPGLFSFSFNKGVRGSGNTVIEKRYVEAFQAVDVSGVFQVEVTAQKDFSVEIEADDNLLPLIKTEVREGVLHLLTEKRVKTSNRILVRISAPDLERVNASGASRVSLVDIRNSSLELDTSGASKVTASGETANLVIDVSGASKIDTEDLRSTNAEVDASGASSVVVNVSGLLKANASGASRVGYTGDPANIEEHTSGASKVFRR
jgi:hypothetical protein